MGPYVVLAYSGGLDTSAIVPWLKERYDARVRCYADLVYEGRWWFDAEYATFEADDVFGQADAAGFIKLFGLPLRIASQTRVREDVLV